MLGVKIGYGNQAKQYQIDQGIYTSLHKTRRTYFPFRQYIIHILASRSSWADESVGVSMPNST